MRWLWLLLAGCNSPHYLCECPDIPAQLTLHVLDAATRVPVGNPTFSEGGRTIGFYCDAPGDGGSCPSWTAQLSGHHVVTVAATGYSPQMLTVDLAPEAGGCCSRGEQLDKTVLMAP
jgi:hypothetical protein